MSSATSTPPVSGTVTASSSYRTNSTYDPNLSLSDRLQDLAEPGFHLLLVVALSTIAFGSVQSRQLVHAERTGSRPVGTTAPVNVCMAITFPIVGSIVLLVLFYFLDLIWYLLYALFAFSSVTAVGYVFSTFVPLVLRRVNVKDRPIGTAEHNVPLSILVSGCFGLTVAVAWIVVGIAAASATPTQTTLTASWLMTDFVAICLGITCLSVLRLPSGQVSYILLVLFFLYDIFWVFLSKYFTSDNHSVMVDVAVSMPDLPILVRVPRLLDPGFFSMLGMGDIVLPGLFLAFLHRFDRHQKPDVHMLSYRGFFLYGLVAYAIGLEVCFVALLAMREGQPALLYLVPSLLITATVVGLVRGDLMEMLRPKTFERDVGPDPESDDREDDLFLADETVEDIEMGPVASDVRPRPSTQSFDSSRVSTLNDADGDDVEVDRLGAAVSAALSPSSPERQHRE